MTKPKKIKPITAWAVVNKEFNTIIQPITEYKNKLYQMAIFDNEKFAKNVVAYYGDSNMGIIKVRITPL